jgi:hypothetical protein
LLVLKKQWIEKKKTMIVNTNNKTIKKIMIVNTNNHC